MNQQDTVNAEILEGLSGAERESYKAGLRALGMNPNPEDRQALRESAAKAFPYYTEAQLDLFVDGEAKPEPEWHLQEALADQDRADFIAQIANAYRELTPGASEEDIAQWATDNEERVKAKLAEPGMAPLTISHCVSAVLQDEADAVKAQEIPDALAARYPGWSDAKKTTWLSDNEPLLMAYRGLHPEWSGEQLIGAVDN